MLSAETCLTLLRYFTAKRDRRECTQGRKAASHCYDCRSSKTRFLGFHWPRYVILSTPYQCCCSLTTYIECRNPLNALFNVTDFLNDTELDEQQGQYVGIIKQCCGDMLRILNDLLDLSKIEAGKIDIENCPFRIRDAITGMMSLCCCVLCCVL